MTDATADDADEAEFECQMAIGRQVQQDFEKALAASAGDLSEDGLAVWLRERIAPLA